MLKNLTAGFVATMVPPAVASAIVYGVALSCEHSCGAVDSRHGLPVASSCDQPLLSTARSRLWLL